jgi:transcriptional regulator
MGKPTDLVQGTLDLLILKTVEGDAKHDWAIAKRIEQVSQDALRVQQGSLYPALYRLEREGWISASWARNESGRRVKVYSLTRSGRRQLARELATWERLSSGIDLVLEGASRSKTRSVSHGSPRRWRCARWRRPRTSRAQWSSSSRIAWPVTSAESACRSRAAWRGGCSILVDERGGTWFSSR